MGSVELAAGTVASGDAVSPRPSSTWVASLIGAISEGVTSASVAAGIGSSAIGTSGDTTLFLRAFGLLPDCCVVLLLFFVLND